MRVTLLGLSLLLVLSGCSSGGVATVIDNSGELHRDYCMTSTEQLLLEEIGITTAGDENNVSVRGVLSNPADRDAAKTYLFIRFYYKDGWWKENYANKMISLDAAVGRNSTYTFDVEVDIPQIAKNQVAENLVRIEASAFFLPS